ncbi:serine arginine-rich splicing factor [Geranomyces variabilis]|uniref:Serine arginine-rich splicing factor n=1 Tax=Geranomyces variabilis TaxID=109894 RepID=A0AAD5TS59_9FUNG|nr:serine arginine-rich splicing factor [Geranomyces variabilis]
MALAPFSRSTKARMESERNYNDAPFEAGVAVTTSSRATMRTANLGVRTEQMLLVGRLPRDATEREVEHLCRDFGRIQEIHLMGGFAFVEYFDHRDARDCVRDLHDAKYSGTRLIVEPARNQPDDDRIRDRDRDRDRGYDRDRDYDRRSRAPPPPHHAHMRSRSPDVYIPERRKEGAYRVIVTGLPESTSWQELKGVMRKAGEVVFADITHQGEG